jgi:Uma2 family endonuclease
MSALTVSKPSREIDDLPILAVDMPVLYEDEGQEEMGDTRPHVKAVNNLYYALSEHFSRASGFDVLSDMNLYYHPVDKWAYVSPDVMVVMPTDPLPEELSSYRIGEHGPAPVVAVEVLSRRTFQQGDLTKKPEIYADLGVTEYLLVDVTRNFLPERLMMKLLGADKNWTTLRDQGRGIESWKFGFGVRLDPDGQVRIWNKSTGRPYPRPEEAAAEARARFEAEIALKHETEARQKEAEARQAAEAEIARLRALLAEKMK